MRRWLSLRRFGKDSDNWMKEVVEQHPLYKEAMERANTIKPEEAIDYEWVLEYSLNCYTRLSQAVDAIDEKAEAIMRYLGGGVAIFSLAGSWLSLYANRGIGLVLLPSILFAIRALHLALKARAPALNPFPPAGKRAYDYATHYRPKDQAFARLSGLVDAASVACSLSLELKGARVRGSMNYFFWAIVLLIPALIAAILIN